ncbi:response regulator transcription factor [Gorillibacterium timonense]|uniref:response regulator transcription factor n=1 Tax=Gorillibacterium timonense TaxID=1689269 RepID=UPI00071E480D|nr:response regulator [Gorillibacterium timonense]
MKLKAMLVDDEMPILNNLKKVLPWERMGLEVVALARNGQEALMAVKEHRPDVILCDIRMPVMDGLVFLEEVRKVDAACEILMLTGYQEFEYARTAMQYGVKDYILKPIDYEQLEAKVGQVAESIRTRRAEDIKKERKWGKAAGLAYEKILRDVVMGFPSVNARNFLVDEGVRVDELAYTVLLVDIDGYSLHSVKWTDNERRLWNFAVGNVLQDALTPLRLPYRVLQIREGEWLILVERQVGDTEASDEAMACWLAALQEAVRDNVKLSVSVGMHPEPVKFAELASTYQTMQRMLLINSGNSKVLAVTDEVLRMADSSRSLWKTMEEMISGLRKQDRARITGALESLRRDIAAEPNEAAVAKAETVLHYLIVHLLREMREMDMVTPQDEDELWTKLQHSLGIKDIMDAVVHLVDRSLASALGKKTSELLMLNAKDYIHRNLASDIGVEEVAGHLGISSSYFSLLFKSHFGETFVEYVTRQRMELAKSMLLMTDKSVTKIGALVGYAERRYFTKVFVKHTGLTPSEFRGARGEPQAGIP